MKRETKSLMAVTAVMYFAIISHLVHTEPIAETKEPVIFVKVKDWKDVKNLKKINYFEHLLKTKE
tara:strand:+ start:1306 stop:1500 length:195 start_codon:yes stop_codon:yes gene_type:complete